MDVFCLRTIMRKIEEWLDVDFKTGQKSLRTIMRKIEPKRLFKSSWRKQTLMEFVKKRKKIPAVKRSCLISSLYDGEIFQQNGQLHIKTEMHNVAVLHDVVFSFQTHFSFFLCRLQRAGSD